MAIRMHASGPPPAKACFPGYRWYILTHLEGSLSNAWLFAKIAGFKGVRNVWPWPSVEAWAIIGTFGALQALLQLALPGKEHKGPVSPKGNVPVYKVCCAPAMPCLWPSHKAKHWRDAQQSSKVCSMCAAGGR